MHQLFTLGAFGSDEASFFDALRRARVDTFVDIRRRRGVRGAQYAFVNATRLQERLRELGIRYVHFKALAPPDALRALQQRDDAGRGVGARERERLAEAFVTGYRRACLDALDVSALLEAVGPQAQRVVLFCVEGAPEGCHRSLAAEHLARRLGLEVEHLRP